MPNLQKLIDELEKGTDSLNPFPFGRWNGSSEVWETYDEWIDDKEILRCAKIKNTHFNNFSDSAFDFFSYKKTCQLLYLMEQQRMFDVGFDEVTSNDGFKHIDIIAMKLTFLFGNFSNIIHYLKEIEKLDTITKHESLIPNNFLNDIPNFRYRNIEKSEALSHWPKSHKTTLIEPVASRSNERKLHTFRSDSSSLHSKTTLTKKPHLWNTAAKTASIPAVFTKEKSITTLATQVLKLFRR